MAGRDVGSFGPHTLALASKGQVVTLALAGVRLIIPDHVVGPPVLRTLSLCTCCRHYPGAAAGWMISLVIPAVSAFPKRVVGSAYASSFSRFARRSFALRPAHSRCHQFVTRIPKASAISSPPQLLRLLPAGAVAGWGLHPLESAALSRRTPRADFARHAFTVNASLLLQISRAHDFDWSNVLGRRAMAGELAYYDEAAAEYDQAFAHVSSHFLPFLLDAAGVAAGMKVLDIATGSCLLVGRSAKWRHLSFRSADWGEYRYSSKCESTPQPRRDVRLAEGAHNQ